MEILTSMRRLYIRFKSLVNDFVYSFGRAALLLLVEVQNHTVPVRERRRIRVNRDSLCLLTETKLTCDVVVSVVKCVFCHRHILNSETSGKPYVITIVTRRFFSQQKARCTPVTQITPQIQLYSLIFFASSPSSSFYSVTNNMMAGGSPT